MVILEFRERVESTTTYEHRADCITTTAAKLINSNEPCQRSNVINGYGLQIQDRYSRRPIHFCLPRCRGIHFRMGHLFPHHNSSRQSVLRRLRNIRVLGRHYPRTFPPLPPRPQNRREALRILSHNRSSSIPTPRVARPKYRRRRSRRIYRWTFTRTRIPMWYDCVLEIDSEERSG